MSSLPGNTSDGIQLDRTIRLLSPISSIGNGAATSNRSRLGGDKGDVYYIQLVDNIRRYKGVSDPSAVSSPQSFRIGRFKGWDDVLPDFRHYKGNTMHRSSPGHADMFYTNTTGRNDIVDAKVARDRRYVYFYVETAENLTPESDPNWMMLFIDTDRDKSTGWPDTISF